MDVVIISKVKKKASTLSRLIIHGNTSMDNEQCKDTLNCGEPTQISPDWWCKWFHRSVYWHFANQLGPHGTYCIGYAWHALAGNSNVKDDQRGRVVEGANGPGHGTKQLCLSSLRVSLLVVAFFCQKMQPAKNVWWISVLTWHPSLQKCDLWAVYSAEDPHLVTLHEECVKSRSSVFCLTPSSWCKSKLTPT